MSQLSSFDRIYNAAKKEDKDELQRLIKTNHSGDDAKLTVEEYLNSAKCVDVRQPRTQGDFCTPASKLAFEGHEKAVLFLIENGANVRYVTAAAAEGGHDALVDKLIKEFSGSPINAVIGYAYGGNLENATAVAKLYKVPRYNLLVGCSARTSKVRDDLRKIKNDLIDATEQKEEQSDVASFYLDMALTSGCEEYARAVLQEFAQSSNETPENVSKVIRNSVRNMTPISNDFSYTQKMYAEHKLDLQLSIPGFASVGNIEVVVKLYDAEMTRITQGLDAKIDNMDAQIKCADVIYQYYNGLYDLTRTLVASGHWGILGELNAKYARVDEKVKRTLATLQRMRLHVDDILELQQDGTKRAIIDGAIQGKHAQISTKWIAQYQNNPRVSDTLKNAARRCFTWAMGNDVSLVKVVGKISEECKITPNEMVQHIDNMEQLANVATYSLALRTFTLMPSDQFREDVACAVNEIVHEPTKKSKFNLLIDLSLLVPRANRTAAVMRGDNTIDFRIAKMRGISLDCCAWLMQARDISNDFPVAIIMVVAQYLEYLPDETETTELSEFFAPSGSGAKSLPLPSPKPC